MKYSAISIQGRKDYMEDEYFISNSLAGGVFAGVYDGHKGGSASLYAKDNMHKLFKEKLKNGFDPENAFIQSYLYINEKLKGVFSGTTAVNIYIKENKLYWANAGDSGLLIVSDKGEAIQLYEDHRLNNSKERERVLDSGGIIANGYAMKGNYGIEPTRALGDHYFSSIGIIPNPFTGEIHLKSKYKWVLLASDGLFDFISNNNICKIISECSSPDEVIEKLKRNVIETGKGNDNFTVVLFNLSK